MKVRLVASALAEEPLQYLVSYVVNDKVAIDAGSIGYALTLNEQEQIRDVVLSHPHIDHVASLPVLLDNTCGSCESCISIHGTRFTLESLQQFIFNDVIWPDFLRLSTPELPLMQVHEITPNESFSIQELQITPIELEHTVPTVGFIIDDGISSVAIVSDTKSTEEIWDKINSVKNLKAVFLEASFPDSMQWLADESMQFDTRWFSPRSKKIETPSIGHRSAYQASLSSRNRNGDKRLQTSQRHRRCVPNSIYEF